MARKNNQNLEGHTDLVDSIILDNEVKGIQYRFTISEFYGKHYIGVREWYTEFEGDFAPSNNGFTIPYELHTTSRLFLAFRDLLSKAEVLQEIEEYVDSELNGAGQ